MPKKPENFGEQKDAKKVFNQMRRPEMYICMAEVFGVFENDKLIKFIDEIKEAMDNKKSWKEVCKNYLPWETIEEKIKTEI